MELAFAVTVALGAHANADTMRFADGSAEGSDCRPIEAAIAAIRDIHERTAN